MGVSLLAEVEDDNGGLLLLDRDIGVRILVVVSLVLLGVVVLGVVLLIVVMGVDVVVMFAV